MTQSENFDNKKLFTIKGQNLWHGCFTHPHCGRGWYTIRWKNTQTSCVLFSSSHLDTRGSCLSPITTPPTFVNVLVVGRNPPPNHTHNTQRRCWVEEGEYKREKRGREWGGEKTLVFSPNARRREGVCLSVYGHQLHSQKWPTNTHTHTQHRKRREKILKPSHFSNYTVADLAEMAAERTSYTRQRSKFTSSDLINFIISLRNASWFTASNLTEFSTNSN